MDSRANRFFLAETVQQQLSFQICPARPFLGSVNLLHVGYCLAKMGKDWQPRIMCFCAQYLGFAMSGCVYQMLPHMLGSSHGCLTYRGSSMHLGVASPEKFCLCGNPSRKLCHRWDWLSFPEVLAVELNHPMSSNFLAAIFHDFPFALLIAWWNMVKSSEIIPFSEPGEASGGGEDGWRSK